MGGFTGEGRATFLFIEFVAGGGEWGGEGRVSPILLFLEIFYKWHIDGRTIRKFL